MGAAPEDYAQEALASIPGRLNKALFKRPGIEAKEAHETLNLQLILDLV